MTNLKEFFESFNDDNKDKDENIKHNNDELLKKSKIIDDKKFWIEDETKDNNENDNKHNPFLFLDEELEDNNQKQENDNVDDDTTKDNENNVRQSNKNFMSNEVLNKQVTQPIKINNHFSTKKINKNFSFKNPSSKFVSTSEIDNFLKKEHLSLDKLIATIESILYVKGQDGLEVVEIQKITKLPLNIITSIIKQMIKVKDEDPQSGLCIRKYGHSYKLLSKQEMYDSVSKVFNRTNTKNISKNTLTVLSIIAYNNNCSKHDIDEIYTKDSSYYINVLLESGLIKKTKSKNNLNLYSITQAFFDKLGISSLKELPNPTKKQDKENEIYNTNDDENI